MRTRPTPQRAPESRRGAALMLSFLVLIVLILIVAQISYSTKTDARVSRNEETLLAMDQTAESVLLQIYDDLAQDGSGGGGGGLGGGTPAAGGGNPLAGGGEGAGPTDSHEDDWAHPQRTELNGMQVRILVQDEDSKLNLLSILTEDEEQAQRAFERLVRLLVNARAGTRYELDRGTARQMATTMLEYMKRRRDQILPRPTLVSDDPEDEDVGLPLTLREFHALDPTLFPAHLFADFRDEDDRIVHSLGSFLTVTSCLTTASEAAGEGGSSGGGNASEGQGGAGGGGDDSGGTTTPQAGQGGAGGQQQEPATADGRINLNTAPPAVLFSLVDDRDVPLAFWDEVLRFRNEPQEDVEDRDPEDIPLDEFGEEIVPKQYFSSFDDIAQVRGWDHLEPIVQGELQGLLKVQSSVFSIYVTVRRPTGEDRGDAARTREEVERQEAEGQGLVRTIRSVVWRRASDAGDAQIIPIVRWEVVDYVPYEVLDDPEGRF